jgi:hypothetical protein
MKKFVALVVLLAVAVMTVIDPDGAKRLLSEAVAQGGKIAQSAVCHSAQSADRVLNMVEFSLGMPQSTPAKRPECEERRTNNT